MTNTELILDQLTTISGGVVFGADGNTFTNRPISNDIKDIKQMENVLIENICTGYGRNSESKTSN